MSAFGFGDLAFLGAAGVAAYDDFDAQAYAQAYITAVEAADGQALETAVRDAIIAFVVGCKADGIWLAIKASCILVGARTLAGALVPLVGTAPTNFNFVAGDYNRKAGLTGNGSTKYLNSNRAANADPRDSSHQSVFIASATWETGRALIGSKSPAIDAIYRSAFGNVYLYSRNASYINTGQAPAAGFYGVSRSSSSSMQGYANATTYSSSVASNPPVNETFQIFRLPDEASVSSTIAFYSIGEWLDLSLLRNRVTALINALAAAIP